MTAGARRVRRVRLAAPRPELVRRGAVLLEDALHTASIPGGAGGRLVLVRRLDVGRIRAGAPPSTLALAIEARLREVELAAVHADDDAAPSAAAVWFHDAAEAYALLAVRLAAGRAADAWFWPAAVPGWRAGMAADDGIRLAMRAAAESVQGAASVAQVLRLAARRGAADRIVSATLTTYAAAVLRTLGWTAAVPADGDRGEPVPAAWRPLLERWIGTWGADDVRSAWLAATVLIAERPARAADRTLPQRATALVRAVELATLSANPDRHPQAAPDAVRIPPREWTEPAAASAERDAVKFEDKVAVPEFTATRADADAHPAARGAAEAERAAREVRNRASSNDLRDDDEAGADRGAARREAPRADHPHPADAEIVARAAEVWHGDDPKSAIDLTPPIIAPIEHTGAAGRRAEERPRRRRMESDGPEPTEAGGLFFLVNALQRLGMAEVLDGHPALLEADLPGRVLLRVAERTRVPADDPALASLADARDAGETGARYSFASPAVWARGIAAAGEARERAEAGRALSWDATGRLLLALHPADADTFALSHSRTFAPDLELITDAWVTALRRWCRRYARTGLHDVVRRRGRMAFTRTHVDVTLPLRGVDVRARGAGLDLDPGWVPWLGRVVAFHYTD